MWDNIKIMACIGILSLFIHRAASLGATDTITWGGDNQRTGYQSNHNMDPAVVGSSQFGQIFKSLLPGTWNGAVEQIFAQPLVYTTPSDGNQYLYVATTQNNIYKLNAATGAIILSRNLHIPFNVTDLDGCVDINPLVGVTATGVIDPDTDTLYLTAKTYQNQAGGQGAQGLLNGRYYFHAIDVNDLSERPGFPVPLEGISARNNPPRLFNGGIHHQRPALLHTGQFIYAGFASHCVHNNFTGWIMGWDKSTGVNVEHYAMEGEGVSNQIAGGGIWMSGGGITSDDAGSIFFATGNGYASQLSTIPVNGHEPPTALEEAAVHMTIGDDGSLAIVDFFMPFEKTQLDGADRDLGTTPLELLPSEFACGDTKRIGVVTGKSGKTYWLDMDNLGGYQNGPNKLDANIQTFQNENSVYAGAGVYPLEGGYIYINVIQYPTHVFSFQCNNGVPSFTHVADSPQNNAYLGVGHGTTTSLNGQTGTGLYWLSDVNGYNLRIYNAVPENGFLTLINKFNIPAVTKFTRPVFGNGRVYIGTTQGFIYGFGSPVNLPLNCSGPYEFGTVDLGSTTATQTITCTALTPLAINNISLSSGTQYFSISGLPTMPVNLATGHTFSFEGSFDPSTTGSLAQDVLISTINNVAGFSTTTSIQLHGTGQSVSPLLSISPITVAFSGYIIDEEVGGVNQTVVFFNQGNSILNISSIQYSNVSETGPFVTANQSVSGHPQIGPFTFYGLPSTIAGQSSSVININFDTSNTGNFPAYLQVNSDGGNKVFDVAGTAGSNPIALFEFQSVYGTNWIPYSSGQNFTFGNVTENQTRSLKLRLTNNATTDAARLSITVSKPPFGVGGLIGANNQVDLGEGTTLAAGENATATLYCSVPKTEWDTDPYSGSAHWTFNVNDPNFTKQDIVFSCNAIAEQAAPLLPNGQGRYRYIGCYKENNPGRQLTSQLYSSANNTTPMCIADCAEKNEIFCGTQYHSECWAGSKIPILQVDDLNCNFACSGDDNQICGGNGVGANAGGAYISLFADSAQYNGTGPTTSNATSTSTSGTATSTSPSTSTSPTSTSGPYVNPGVAGYTSIGCYTEPPNARALPQLVATPHKTVASCLNTCGALNYLYIGLEYGGECWCGNALHAGANATAITDCNMLCADNSTEYCGAGLRLNMYEFGITVQISSSSGVSNTVVSSATSSLSSLSSSASSSTTLLTTTTSSLPQSSTSSTPFFTSSSSTSSGSIVSSSTSSILSGQGSTSPVTSLSSTTSSSTSPISLTSRSSLSSSITSDPSTSGISTSITAPSLSSSASSTLSSTQSPSTASISSSTSLPTRPSSTSSSSSTTSPTSPSIKPSIAPYWVYQGCWTEATNMRALSLATFANDSMTLEACALFCQGKGTTMFGTEYARECYCGDVLNTGSVNATNQADCNFPCPGDKTEYCGAGNRLELYSSVAVSSTTTLSRSSLGEIQSTSSVSNTATKT